MFECSDRHRELLDGSKSFSAQVANQAGERVQVVGTVRFVRPVSYLEGAAGVEDPVRLVLD